ncbi:MAG: MerR family DNA-binding transcriptional regulator [Chloroflexi bacterium]|nr:MerR family DNA-binding transcriptional regulator [Chloroflexota bacterium]
MRLLTTGEVAHRLDRSAEQVRRYERAGLLKATKTARGYRLFSAEDVKRFRRRLERLSHARLRARSSRGA